MGLLDVSCLRLGSRIVDLIVNWQARVEVRLVDESSALHSGKGLADSGIPRDIEFSGVRSLRRAISLACLSHAGDNDAILLWLVRQELLS